MQTRHIRQHVARHSIVIGVAAMLLGSAPAFAREDATTPPDRTMVGVYTGQDADGRPVYRLPAITVQASRKAELAKTAAEARQASARATSSRPAPQRPAAPVHVAAR